MKLHYGDLLAAAEGGEFDVIMHGCNCFHTMGAGIAAHIKRKYPEAYAADKGTPYGDAAKLGTFSSAKISRLGVEFVVLNAYTQHGFGGGVDNFDYASFPSLLAKVKNEYGTKRIGLPLIGCGLAGGDESRILKMMKEGLSGTNYKLMELNRERRLSFVDPDDALFESGSDSFPSPLTYGGLSFASPLHFVEFCKAKAFGDSEACERIARPTEDAAELLEMLYSGELDGKAISNDSILRERWIAAVACFKKEASSISGFDQGAWSAREEKTIELGRKLAAEGKEVARKIVHKPSR